MKLRRPPLAVLTAGETNYFRFRLGPEISISLGAQVKEPGPHMRTMPAELSFVRTEAAEEYGAYERLLGDAMHGDPQLFVRQDAVEASWAIVNPILGDRTFLGFYEPGTWGPPEADRLAAAIGGWHNPAPEQAMPNVREHGKPEDGVVPGCPCAIFITRNLCQPTRLPAPVGDPVSSLPRAQSSVDYS